MQAERSQLFIPMIQKMDRWIRELMNELPADDPNQAERALRAVLHTLRDRLIPTEAVDLAAQLPLIARGIYYEGWKMTDTPKPWREREEFLEAVRQKMRPDEGLDAEHVVKAVLAMLDRHVTTGEIQDIRSQLPKDIETLWPNHS